jgi:sporulation protein YlmC with PRC-barrel domain
MADADGEAGKGRRPVSDALRERLSVRRALEGQLVSLVNLLGRPLLDVEGTRVGKVDDVVVRWERNSAYPRVVAILARVGKGYAVVAADDITISQTGVKLRSDRQVVARPVRQRGDVALARDVLDHQLVDLAGVEVVRANDVYLFMAPMR